MTINKDVIMDLIIGMDEGAQKAESEGRFATASCYLKALASVLDHLEYMPETAKDRRLQAQRLNERRYARKAA